MIDVDSKHFPNLALMKLSAWHKARGDTVDWWWTDMIHYDIVYMSKVFSTAYSPDVPEPMNAGKVIKGGTGYCITLGPDGRERFDPALNINLPPEVERCFPDYSIYPQYDFAVAMTSRGCDRRCGFCHVSAKEGRRSVKVADVWDFWNGQKKIKVLDPNLTACAEKRELLRQYRETGALIDFTQGLDIRLLDDEDIEDINAMRIAEIHFAWDSAKEDLSPFFRRYAERATHRPHGSYGTVYILTNYNSTLADDLFRIYTLRDLNYNPYVMVYNKPAASKELRALQSWCNNRKLFGACRRFEDFTRG